MDYSAINVIDIPLAPWFVQEWGDTWIHVLAVEKLMNQGIWKKCPNFPTNLMGLFPMFFCLSPKHIVCSHLKVLHHPILW